MEFNEKLQNLRKQKGLTQEELAEALYVSRTAISKWESGRGYPNIESLKRVAKFFSVTVDELLSGDEILDIAQEDSERKENSFRNMVFGMLDISVLLYLFLPLFGQKSGEVVENVSLLSLSDISSYLKTAYYILVIGMSVWGFFTVAVQPLNQTTHKRVNNKISLMLSFIGVLLFIISTQPYAAVFMLAFLMIKVLMTRKVS